MKDLYIIVEGKTEVLFVERILIPYFNKNDICTNIQSIQIEKRGGGHGFNNIEHFKNTIAPILSYQNLPIITTIIDYYGINSEKKMPGYELCILKNSVFEIVNSMETVLKNIVNSIKPNNNFIPNLILHEFETLLFADPTNGFGLEEPKSIIQDILKIKNDYQNIEEINSSFETAPSKRLQKIFENYGQKFDKLANGLNIAELTTIEKMLESSPRFKNWIEKIIFEIRKSKI